MVVLVVVSVVGVVEGDLTSNGAGSGMSRVGIEIGSIGAMGSVAGGTISMWVSGRGAGVGNGPMGSLSSPVSPSGTEDGAATGSENTGSVLVVLVILSIARCKSLSTF